jgi:L-threonylcarbamoyladenylate synthase
VRSFIQQAAELIRSGELVAFPTETVYGLGANALDPAAVERIYEAKGRPSTSPLIVHVDSIEMAQRVTREWPLQADALARRFWPGALTLVLRKRSDVPDRVTAGLQTVGVRVPAHPVALELIRAAGVPIAAPSANRFTGLSPTTAGHVRRSLGDRVAMILDGGPTQVGIESTVLSLVDGKAVLLRPGMIPTPDLESVIGEVQLSADPARNSAHSSPGQHRKHYSPNTRLILVDRELPSTGRGAYLWIDRPMPCAHSIQMPRDAAAYAAHLYSTLHEADGEHWDWIAVQRPPDEAAWAGIHDRLERASKE